MIKDATEDTERFLSTENAEFLLFIFSVYSVVKRFGK